MAALGRVVHYRRLSRVRKPTTDCCASDAFPRSGSRRLRHQRLILAFGLKDNAARVWVALSGAVTLLLGMMILARWPSSLFVLGLFLGIDLVVAGVSWISTGMALRKP